jgi:hypothetical protein
LQQPFTMQLLNTIKIPSLNGKAGPIHTILQDERQNIYYSDELNHSVVSLNEFGDIRWHHSKQGKNQGEFYYPKGIDIGWITIGSIKTECIAVCDSWNSRIQLFDHDGHYLTTWDRVGDDIFRDVVDIRFVVNDENYYWLVLDRDHHCIFWLDTSGLLIKRSGRAFPHKLESNWAVPRNRLRSRASCLDNTNENLPYDPLFLPLRIYGSDEKALLIWEPKSNRLKQAAYGNIVPIWIELPEGAEWAGANTENLLCFNKSSRMLGSYDAEAQTWDWVRINGVPIPSWRSWKEIWIQNESLINCWSCSRALGDHNMNLWMIASLPDEITRIMHTGILAADIHPLEEVVNRLREISYNALDAVSEQLSDSTVTQDIKNDVVSWSQEFSEALLRVKPFSYSAFLGFLKIQALQNLYAAEECRYYFQQALDRIENAPLRIENMAPITHLYREMFRLRDEWLVACNTRIISRNSHSIDIRTNILKECSDVQNRALSELSNWLMLNSYSPLTLR